MEDTLKQNIMKDLGLDLLPPEERDEALLRVGNIIFKSVLLRVLDELDEKQKDAFDATLDANPDNQEAVFEFLRSNVPDFDALVADVIAKFRQESLATTQQIS